MSAMSGTLGTPSVSAEMAGNACVLGCAVPLDWWWGQELVRTGRRAKCLCRKGDEKGKRPSEERVKEAKLH